MVLSAESARPCPVSPVAPVSPVERAVALRGVHEQSSLENVINIRCRSIQAGGFPESCT